MCRVPSPLAAGADNHDGAHKLSIAEIAGTVVQGPLPVRLTAYDGSVAAGFSFFTFKFNFIGSVRLQADYEILNPNFASFSSTSCRSRFDGMDAAMALARSAWPAAIADTMSISSRDRYIDSRR